jgi:hypothetical protein
MPVNQRRRIEAVKDEEAAEWRTELMSAWRAALRTELKARHLEWMTESMTEG